MKAEFNQQISLDIIQNNAEIVCYQCGISNYRKRGMTKAGKQRYFCLTCQRHFIENVDYANYKPSYLELGDDVWNANDLGIKTREYKQETKLVFCIFSRIGSKTWLKNSLDIKPPIYLLANYKNIFLS